MPTLLSSTNITALQLKEAASPGTPSSGYGRLYFYTDNTLHIVNDAGTDINLTGLYTGAIALASQAANDLAYASSATQWARIANGTTGQALIATTGSAPSWGAPTLITVADTTDTTCYVGLWEDATGNLAPKTDGGLTYNASTGVLTATGFSGPLTGAVTGNASTATALQTGRTINGTTFDGTGNITVTAAAGTLTGTTLNATVVTTSATAVGTIATGVWQGTSIKPGYGGTGAATVALSDGATPALDASLGTVFRLAAAGDRTIAVPSNATASQRIIIQHYASGGARTLALNSGAGGFRFGTDVTALTETTSGKTDYIGCVYNDTDSKWDVVAYAKGY